MDSPELANNIKLNYNSDALNCKNLEGMKTCEVPASHFNGESGYYLPYYSNLLNKTRIFYNSVPIEVSVHPNNHIIFKINSEYNNKTINVGKEGTLYL